jgi:hypothetical protein
VSGGDGAASVLAAQPFDIVRRVDKAIRRRCAVIHLNCSPCATRIRHATSYFASHDDDVAIGERRFGCAEISWLHPLECGSRCFLYHFFQAIDAVTATALPFRPRDKGVPFRNLLGMRHGKSGIFEHLSPFGLGESPVVAGVAQSFKSVHIMGGPTILWKHVVLHD